MGVSVEDAMAGGLSPTLESPMPQRLLTAGRPPAFCASVSSLRSRKSLMHLRGHSKGQNHLINIQNKSLGGQETQTNITY